MTYTKMWTRRKILDFDFDDASREWKRNKISQGNGTYTYKCCVIKRNGKECEKPRYLCKQHKRINNLNPLCVDISDP